MNRSKCPKFELGGPDTHAGGSAHECTANARDLQRAKIGFAGWFLVVAFSLLETVGWVLAILAGIWTAATALIAWMGVAFAQWAGNLRRQQLCDHDWYWQHNLYGPADVIISCGGMRSAWKCSECKRTEYRPDLFEPEVKAP